jgi:hypothetical protein
MDKCVRAWHNTIDVEGIILEGGVGTGKSSLAALRLVPDLDFDSFGITAATESNRTADEFNFPYEERLMYTYEVATVMGFKGNVLFDEIYRLGLIRGECMLLLSGRGKINLVMTGENRQCGAYDDDERVRPELHISASRLYLDASHTAEPLFAEAISFIRGRPLTGLAAPGTRYTVVECAHAPSQVELAQYASQGYIILANLLRNGERCAPGTQGTRENRMVCVLQPCAKQVRRPAYSNEPPIQRDAYTLLGRLRCGPESHLVLYIVGSEMRRQIGNHPLFAEGERRTTADGIVEMEVVEKPVPRRVCGRDHSQPQPAPARQLVDLQPANTHTSDLGSYSDRLRMPASVPLASQLPPGASIYTTAAVETTDGTRLRVRKETQNVAYLASKTTTSSAKIAHWSAEAMAPDTDVAVPGLPTQGMNRLPNGVVIAKGTRFRPAECAGLLWAHSRVHDVGGRLLLFARMSYLDSIREHVKMAPSFRFNLACLDNAKQLTVWKRALTGYAYSIQQSSGDYHQELLTAVARAAALNYEARRRKGLVPAEFDFSTQEMEFIAQRCVQWLRANASPIPKVSFAVLLAVSCAVNAFKTACKGSNFEESMADHTSSEAKFLQFVEENLQAEGELQVQADYTDIDTERMNVVVAMMVAKTQGKIKDIISRKNGLRNCYVEGQPVMSFETAAMYLQRDARNILRILPLAIACTFGQAKHGRVVQSALPEAVPAVPVMISSLMWVLRLSLPRLTLSARIRSGAKSPSTSLLRCFASAPTCLSKFSALSLLSSVDASNGVLCAVATPVPSTR